MARQDRFANVSKRVLDINSDLSSAVDACQECAVKWNPIGLQLGLAYSQLEEIDDAAGTSRKKLQKVLAAWLQKDTLPGSSDPSYYQLCHAVAKGGGNPALADRIAAAHPASADGTRSTAQSSVRDTTLPVSTAALSGKPPKDIFQKALPRLSGPLGKEPNFTDVTNLLLGGGLITKPVLSGIKTHHNLTDNQRGSEVAHALLDKIKASDDPVQCLLEICDVLEDGLVGDDDLKKHGANMRSQLPYASAVSTDTSTVAQISKSADEQDQPPVDPRAGLRERKRDKNKEEVDNDTVDGPARPTADLSLPDIGEVKDNVFSYSRNQLGDIYKMNTNPRGYCLIVNISKGRKGSDKDADDLTEAFKKLHFEVKEYRNLTAAEIRQLAKNVRAADHSKLSCFVIVLLAHGDDGQIVGCGGQNVLISDLEKDITECQSLYGKPKLLFVQACRGKFSAKGIEYEVEEEDDSIEDDEDDRWIITPKETDFLMAYATPRGHKAKRNPVRGSRFIQSLVEVFNEDADRLDVLSLLTKVNKKVSRMKRGDAGVQHVPETTYRLSKTLYFGKPPSQSRAARSDAIDEIDTSGSEEEKKSRSSRSRTRSRSREQRREKRRHHSPSPIHERRRRKSHSRSPYRYRRERESLRKGRRSHSRSPPPSRSYHSHHAYRHRSPERERRRGGYSRSRSRSRSPSPRPRSSKRRERARERDYSASPSPSPERKKSKKSKKEKKHRKKSPSPSPSLSPPPRSKQKGAAAASGDEEGYSEGSPRPSDEEYQ